MYTANFYQALISNLRLYNYLRTTQRLLVALYYSLKE